MNKILCVAFLIISSYFTYGQSQKAKDSLIKIMVSEACNEIKKKDFSIVKKEDIEMEIGMAVVPVFSGHAEDLKEILNLEITDTEGMKDFGEILGVKLAVDCPEFMRIVSGSKSFADEVKRGQTKPATSRISGTLVKVVPGELSYFLVKDSQGKTHKIWWMEFFEGDDKLKDAKNVNKPVAVKYKETEVYSSAVKDYIKIKIVTGIE